VLHLTLKKGLLAKVFRQLRVDLFAVSGVAFPFEDSQSRCFELETLYLELEHFVQSEHSEKLDVVFSGD
jgi:hypothetical protein